MKRAVAGTSALVAVAGSTAVAMPSYADSVWFRRTADYNARKPGYAETCVTKEFRDSASPRYKRDTYTFTMPSTGAGDGSDYRVGDRTVYVEDNGQRVLWRVDPGPLQFNRYGAWGESGKRVNEGTTAQIWIHTWVTWFWAAGGNQTFYNAIGYSYAGWHGPGVNTSRCPDWGGPPG